ncbi:MAG: AraC family transcriptional regulator [Chloroflexi bacterium]|nr:MAG: AraC family transcriptional regulator [Chloroflexota bacterium]MBL1195599.1 AraC family transcriptional regulator [Chloroflexota bacterium]NOH12886.1 AraC family transcriptional regulator [Chloroflexota bacterium]
MYTEFRPKHLSHLVEAIWFADSDVDPDEGHIAPLSLGSQLVIKLYPSDYETALSGPVTRQTYYPFVEGARYFGVQFAPGVGPAFENVLLKDLKDSSVDIDKVLGIDLNSLAHHIHDVQTWVEQSRLIEKSLRKQYPQQEHFLNHNILFAMDIAQECKGDISIYELAAIVGISRRQLERLFIRYTGVTPKAFCKTLRVQSVLDRLQQANSAPLAELAKDCGYTDQAHLANEFRQTMGTSISAYLDANAPVGSLAASARNRASSPE